jgi:hypothetical protein
LLRAAGIGDARRFSDRAHPASTCRQLATGGFALVGCIAIAVEIGSAHLLGAGNAGHYSRAGAKQGRKGKESW